MPVAAITGKLRRKIWTDISTALGLGVSSGYAYWYFYYIPSVRRRQEYYLKLEKEKLAAAGTE
ncbi:SubName: Full=Uncharacterized protein {ECO:0000313/EMBL:CCA71154.1} [Serendipita indica DSM 11827]|uniref:Cytochrome c oxidase polypeptide VIIA n=1 Tax=Serendipita indica (strain DSM 11827) TaxID=1109443 RepID=G4TIL1_SERID|nr:SubName: Full=Uncharacterized protein {ECO:0000313/EMBL:CCA71154.1} [Serendipita indica DSM 11827]CCA71154.1 hypothetical protein PIIN_05089 [Serendipita indica DSM 11827]